eukprot:scaffold49135_cov76-Phaeocystis_antarctica.AAC.6
MKASSASSAFGRTPSSAWVASAASRMVARLEEVQEVLRAGGEGHPVRFELEALGADNEVGQPVVAPEAGERGMVWHAAPLMTKQGKGKSKK